MTCNYRKKGLNQNFVTAWSLGMNDYEIAKSFGINVETLRTVKRDLSLLDPGSQYQTHSEESDPSR